MSEREASISFLRPGSEPDDDGRRDSLGQTSQAANTGAAFKSASSFVGEFVPLSYAMEPVVRTSSIYTLTARTGAGKTGFLIAAALAVAGDRSSLVGMDIEAGRVAYVVVENPDDFRMRLMVASWCAGIDLDALGDHLVVLDRRLKPEDIILRLEALAMQHPFQLIIIDTLAALFDGDDMNAAVQGGNFMRRLRGLTTVAGKPSVLVAAHPVKNAAEDNLLPYGSGAILNEVDGNLTLWRRPESGTVELHWQGKLRGLEFQPRPFRIENFKAPDVVDRRGQQVAMPILAPTTGADLERQRDEDADTKLRLLRAMFAQPDGSLETWGRTIERTKSIVHKHLKALAKMKLVEQVLRKWILTAKGRREAEKGS